MKNKLLTLALSSAALLSACSDGEDYEPSFDQMNWESVVLPGSSPEKMESVDKFADFQDNPFINVSESLASTFSIDADGAAYAIMRNYTSVGWSINKSSARIEEYLNYFPFDYPEPTGNDNVAINYELGTCPWNQEHKLLRLGIKGKTLEADKVPLANYVFLVDVSGSMDEKNKLPLLKSCLLSMLEHLNPNDKISIVTYAGEVKLVLESTPVSEISKIQNSIKSLNANGITNGGDALKMAYDQAINNYDPEKNNRIILGTDGDFNFGITSTEELVKIVEGYARKGIYLTACGFGYGNLNDAMMEKISNSGNGTYEYIDCEDEMMKVFVHERGKFSSVANDSKCQVTFDPEYIKSYRLIGYENRVLNREDFVDDSKDAGEIGSGQTITALYEIEPTEKFVSNITSPVAKFNFRYKKSLNSESIPLSLEIMNEEGKELSENFTFAAGVAAFGLSVRNSPYKGLANFEMAKSLISKSLTFDPYNYRSSFLSLIDKVKVSE